MVGVILTLQKKVTDGDAGTRRFFYVLPDFAETILDSDRTLLSSPVSPFPFYN
ncbi:hypothetical protein [Calothrix sp. UHCC 0171]|uniref:hypothetical protein n=1 Tax=Calothrix sp. UHCC 0171 TaxID=3110245 RepID=UPI002B203767|nr:hypothetical protein [Calothrix sp. UHCC 0171]MEA5569580.1 hypothetical protein [Calothrix sp. UHCC 0171]